MTIRETLSMVAQWIVILLFAIAIYISFYYAMRYIIIFIGGLNVC